MLGAVQASCRLIPPQPVGNGNGIGKIENDDITGDNKTKDGRRLDKNGRLFPYQPLGSGYKHDKEGKFADLSQTKTEVPGQFPAFAVAP